ncbi:putative membrane protein [Parapedobacter luteus]|uniref:Putative membrane protein n=2 Tax=Parapedobacter luteus TaxID=623280 RepID=A0A1T5EXQ8_9SPHI|nr:putative membrane protein [Parapedobacter luteus]
MLSTAGILTKMQDWLTFELMNKDLILRERLALQRTILANQSTFLSFLRTAMYFAIAGISVDRLLELPGGHVYEYVFFAISAVVLVAGVVNYFVHKKKIARSEKHIGDYKLDYEGQDTGYSTQ